jgi:hypothetical protein
MIVRVVYPRHVVRSPVALLVLPAGTLVEDNLENVAFMIAGTVGLVDGRKTVMRDALCECDGRAIDPQAAAIVAGL